ncbi:disease resistance protein RUN1-like [Rosa sericea]
MVFTSTPPRSYDVFLSFRGKDTREGFTESLYQKLRWHKFDVFKDNTEPKIGMPISEKLLTAIEESKTAVIVISQNFASSTWCLDELLKILECMEARKTVFPVFYDVDPSHVRHQLGSFEKAFRTHEQRPKQDLLKVQLWRDALKKMANFVGWWTSKDHDSETKVLEKIVEEVHAKVNPVFTLSGSKDKLFGIESALKTIIGHLKPEVDDVLVLGIWGISGTGVKDISKTETIVHLQNQLLSQILKENVVDEFDVYGEITSITEHCLRNRKALLILDDVDDINQLEALAVKEEWLGKGSRIIITTRDPTVLRLSGVQTIYKCGLRTREESIKLFSQKAFHKDEPAEDYLKFFNYFVQVSQGHSLGLKILGSALYGKGLHVWESAFDRLRKNPCNDFHSLLRCGFDGLYDTEKDIFLDVLCFFRGELKERVIKILGSLFVGAHVMVYSLVEKSFLTVSNNNCVEMHDLIQELGWEIVREESVKQPGKRSRLWDQDDIVHVLASDTGTEAIECIFLNLPDDHESTMIEDRLNPKAFSKMSNLRFLKIHNLRMSLPLISKYLPDSLRHFEWSCSFQA